MLNGERMGYCFIRTYAVWNLMGRVYNDEVVYGKYLGALGYQKVGQPVDKRNNLKIKGSRFVEQYNGPFVAHIGSHHLVYGNQGRIYDTWDSTDRVVGNFWVPINYVNQVINTEWRY